MKFTVEQIAAALGEKFPLEHIRDNWPRIWASLHAHAIDGAAAQIATIATVAVETGTFTPRHEVGQVSDFVRLYWDRANVATALGNRSAQDAVQYRGRGFIQITGRTNYRHYGELMGLDLLADPEQALDPLISAEILALYFHEHDIARVAALGQWERVRRRVNGGLNGWNDFIRYVRALQQLQEPPAPEVLTT